MVLPNMFTMILFKFKIFYAVIAADTVYVMDHFFTSKGTPKVLFHNQAMFPNPTMSVCRRMAGGFYQYIARIYGFTTFPAGVFLKRIGSIEAASTQSGLAFDKSLATYRTVHNWIIPSGMGAF